MKRSTYNKLWLLIPFVVLGCKGQVQNGSTNTETEIAQDSAAMDRVHQNSDKLKTMEKSTDSIRVRRNISNDTDRTTASSHNAPNQEELDSIKQLKTKGKRKN